jgi:arylsulfatase A-like enzyme
MRDIMGKAGISRRSALAGAAGTLAACQALTPIPNVASKPNIVFILADDLGAFDLSCYGRPDYKTPSIDSLARDGAMLTRAYSNSSTCSPTRAALITGRYQNRLPMGNYDPLPPGKGLGLPAGTPTLPRQFKALGYATALVGKWHLGDIPEHGPLRHGYDEFFGFPDGAMDYHSHDLGDVLFPLPGAARLPKLYEGDALTLADGYATDLFTGRAVDFINRKSSAPFFLSLHYNAPHWPWQTRTDRAEGRHAEFNHDGGSPAIYAEMVRILDESVGKVLKALDANNVDQNTIVVFTSDNGGERFSYMWPLRGGKASLYEGGLRVPCLVRWPGRIRRASQSEQVAITMDWLPTLLAMAGGRADASYPSDGLDLSPMLTGAGPVERTLFWRTGGWAAVRSGPWKYVNNGLEHLYNLDTDETERANLKRRHPDIFAKLKSQWDAWNSQMTPIPSDALANPESARRAEALDPAPPSPSR